MRSLLERALDSLSSFIPYEEAELWEQFFALSEGVRKANKYNIKALIPVDKIPERTLDISQKEPGEDYEILTGYRVDNEGNIWRSEKEYREYLLTEIAPEIVNNEEIEVWLEDRLKEYNRFKFYPDEISFVIVYQYGYRFDTIDRAIAEDVGLAVVDVYHDGFYLAITGNWFDYYPKLVAYKAIKFGYISETDLSYFTDEVSRRNFIDNVGHEVYAKILNKFGIPQFIEGR